MHPLARRVLTIIVTAVAVTAGALLFVYCAVFLIGYGAMGAIFGAQMGLASVSFFDFASIGWAVCGAVVGAVVALGGLAYAANSLAQALTKSDAP
jgi:hypothetical protein